ncbi:nicotinate-nucleotide--dimethylbenzimidazole phosphoribosyltransferase [Frateuria aurantia]
MTQWYLQPCAEVNVGAAEAARQRQAQLTKPAGSLGQLESLAITLAGLQGRRLPAVDKAWITVFAADHGIAAAGVSAYPQAVTGEMLRNFAQQGAAIAVLASEQQARLEVVNLGVVNDPGELPGVRREIIAASTASFLQAAAMEPGQLEMALLAGRRSVERAVAEGAELLICGEMGIGNTTSAAALACGLLDEPPGRLAGRGTGVDAAGLQRKIDAITAALAFHGGPHTATEWLRRLGGFELAAMTGAYIAAAQLGVPVLVDGFVTTAAALAAVRIQPEARAWMLFSHRSQEAGHTRLLQAMDGEPLLDLGLRLGEASGAAAALPLLRLACAVHARMATFGEAGVSEA